jgi:hypothetical protein
MRGDWMSHPGAVRRWWWRSSQGQRLAMALPATLLGMAVVAVGAGTLDNPSASGPGPSPVAPGPVAGVPGSVSMSLSSTTLPNPGAGSGLTSGMAVPGGSATGTAGSAGRPPGSQTLTTPNQAPGGDGPPVSHPAWPPPPPPDSPGTTATRPPVTSSSVAPPPPGGVQQGVSFNAPCSPQGAEGVTKQGQQLRCEPVGNQDRWRQA